MRITTREYFAMPESVLPQELLYGAWRVADAPLRQHQEAVGRLFLALTAFLKAHPIGRVWLAPLDVVLDAERAVIVQPDLVFVSKAREGIVFDRIYGAPDLVIEVLSPNPRVGSTDARLELFARYGVRECWVVRLPESCIDVLVFDDGRLVRCGSFCAMDPIDSTVLAGFRETFLSIVGAS